MRRLFFFMVMVVPTLASGGTYIAIAHSRAVRSTNNGVTWSDFAAGGSSARLAYCNGALVAVPDSGTAATYSTDLGATWSSSTVLPVNCGWAVTCSPNLNRFVAVCNGNTSTYATSDDGGKTWVSRTLPRAASWQWVVYDDVHSKFVVGEANFYTENSTDGISGWAEHAYARGIGWGYAAAYCNGKIAVQDVNAGVYNGMGYSSDGGDSWSVGFVGSGYAGVRMACTASAWLEVGNVNESLSAADPTSTWSYRGGTNYHAIVGIPGTNTFFGFASTTLGTSTAYGASWSNATILPNYNWLDAIYTTDLPPSATCTPISLDGAAQTCSTGGSSGPISCSVTLSTSKPGDTIMACGGSGSANGSPGATVTGGGLSWTSVGNQVFGGALAVATTCYTATAVTPLSGATITVTNNDNYTPRTILSVSALSGVQSVSNLTPTLEGNNTSYYSGGYAVTSISGSWVWGANAGTYFGSVPSLYAAGSTSGATQITVGEKTQGSGVVQLGVGAVAMPIVGRADLQFSSMHYAGNSQAMVMAELKPSACSSSPTIFILTKN